MSILQATAPSARLRCIKYVSFTIDNCLLGFPDDLSSNAAGKQENEVLTVHYFPVPVWISFERFYKALLSLLLYRISQAITKLRNVKESWKTNK